MVNELKKVRTRFAPSPTGYLHVGGARTALFSYLFARHYGGDFILRIEDTDLERSTEESVQVILEGMSWLGMDCDEGPFYQSKRFDRYLAVANELLESGSAYKCFCSKERLDALREKQKASNQKVGYDGCCRNSDNSDKTGPYVVRFKTPQEGEVTFTDLVRGPITVSNAQLDDLILVRSDGTPTYNFTVVVDDADMNITHVIRGDDHINNTHRQINLFEALNYDVPYFAHVPMILGHDGKRLSKRHGAVSVMQYRDDGILPQALLNYLVRLGWSHGDQEIFSMNEMVALFDFDSVNKSSATFNLQKLHSINKHYMGSVSRGQLVSELERLFALRGIDLSAGPELTDLISMQCERCETLVEVVEKSLYFYQDFQSFEEKAARKNLKSEAEPVLLDLLQRFSAQAEWLADPLHKIILAVAEQRELKLGKVAQSLRVALTGGAISPPLDQTLYHLGRDRVLKRLQQAIDFIQ